MTDKRLETWWNGLDPTEQDDVLQAETTGHVAASTRKSLASAGLVDDGSTSDDDVVKLLKMRH
jgi:hypothetical protein